MGIKRKILSLFSAVVMGATVIFTAAGGEHVQAAETYKVNSSVADVSGNVCDTIEIPIIIYHRYTDQQSAGKTVDK